MSKMRQWYIQFVERENRNLFGECVYLLLLLLSFIYGVCVRVRNLLFDRKILKQVDIGKKVVSIGNISWGGSGKTSLVIYLHRMLSQKYRVATITKGYAPDEFMLLKKEVGYVFDGRDRIKVIKDVSSNFDVFILDDGFQYRRLERTVDIVTMSDKEFRKSPVLIPAGIFREPFKSMRRADIAVITYWHRIKNIKDVIEGLKRMNPSLKVYLAEYNFKEILDRNMNPTDLEELKKRKTAVLTAIGYPEGFLAVLREAGIVPQERFIYPDHHRFGAEEVAGIERFLVGQGIEDVVITHKDFYHIDFRSSRLRYFIFKVEISIIEEESFLEDIEKLMADGSKT